MPVLHAGTAGFPRISVFWLERVLHNAMIEMSEVKKKKKKKPNKLIKEICEVSATQICGTPTLVCGVNEVLLGTQ